MKFLKELPQGLVWPHLIEAIKAAAETELRDYAAGRSADVERGAETPALAATLVDKFAVGMAMALEIVGIDTEITRISDSLVREIDPSFERHRAARWAAHPAGLAFGIAPSSDVAATVERGVALLALCQKLQSQADGVDRPKILDSFAGEISEAITFHYSLLKLLPMALKLADIGRALHAKQLVTVDYGDDYAEAALAYLSQQLKDM